MIKRFEALDAFRGLCAIFVVLSHMHFAGSISEYSFFRGSGIFVEFFFVLSGFVLAHSYGYRAKLQFKQFFKARFFRIFPLHIFMLMVFIALELGKFIAYKFTDITFIRVPFSGSNTISEIIPNLLLIQAWTPFAENSFNSPSWSISIEFYMYMLLFGSLLIFKRYKAIAWFTTSLIMLFALGTGTDLLQHNVLRGLSCFFGGAATYVLYKKLSGIKINNYIGSIIELFLIISVVFVVQSDIEYRQIIATVTFFFVVLFFAFESGYISSLLKMASFQTLGRLSYSIYMIHSAILLCLTSTMMVLQKVIGTDFTLMVNGARVLTTGNVLLNNIIIIMTLAVVIACSHVTYKYIEMKGQKLGKKL